MLLALRSVFGDKHKLLYFSTVESTCIPLDDTLSSTGGRVGQIIRTDLIRYSKHMWLILRKKTNANNICLSLGYNAKYTKRENACGKPLTSHTLEHTDANLITTATASHILLP